MNIPLVDLQLDGFGPLTTSVFYGAGLRSASDIVTTSQSECGDRLASSIKRCRAKSLIKEDAYWAEVTKKCATIVTKIRIAHISPDIPSWCKCPITGDVMSDPVVTPKGTSYERVAIVESIKLKSVDPMHGTPLHIGQLTPNLQLSEAIQNIVVSQNIRFVEDDLEM